MTRTEWRTELERAVAAAGHPWRVVAAWVDGALCGADLIDLLSGLDNSVRLCAAWFRTDAERQEEIARQLRAGGR